MHAPISHLRRALIGASIALLAAVSTDSSAVTTRTAQAEVSNRTGKDIAFLRIEHKYSSDFIIWLDAAYLLDGTTSGNFFQKQCFTDQDGSLLEVSAQTALCEITYNTGFGTTGRDWWRVSWSYVGDDKVYFTDPNNFRSQIDLLEKYSVPLVSMAAATAGVVAGAACTAATAGACGPLVAAGIGGLAVVYGGAITAITAESTSSNSTAGFKQHILEDEDEGKTTRIVLNKDGTVVFTSSSGSSETVYSSKTPTPLDAQQRGLVEREIAANLAPGPNWSTVRNAGIPGQNRETVTDIGLPSCKVLCELKDWCESVDYERDAGTCFLQPVGQDTKALRTDYPGDPYDHYGYARDVATR